jgi:hypothetical protein
MVEYQHLTIRLGCGETSAWSFRSQQVSGASHACRGQRDGTTANAAGRERRSVSRLRAQRGEGRGYDVRLAVAWGPFSMSRSELRPRVFMTINST